MITLQFASPWSVCTPVMHRFLDSSYVDAFFEDGSLRLSSFARFRQHEDEQRLDAQEGQSMFVHRDWEGQGQTITAVANHGDNAYVLCGSMWYSEQVQDDFACDSYLRIEETTGFGEAVLRHVPGAVAGAEGPCLYQTNRIIERNLGTVSMEGFLTAREGEQLDLGPAMQMIQSAMGHLPFFLKERLFAHQAEYRLLWFVERSLEPYIDIKVPEARKFCTRPLGLMR